MLRTSKNTFQIINQMTKKIFLEVLCCNIVFTLKFHLYAEAVLKFAKLNAASVASRSVCSRAKPTAHTGFGIPNKL
jgi:hypothetical protein